MWSGALPCRFPQHIAGWIHKQTVKTVLVSVQDISFKFRLLIVAVLEEPQQEHSGSKFANEEILVETALG